MNARPGVVLWVCAGVGANTPNDEFVRVWWALENIGVVPIQAALQLDNRRSPVGHRHGVVVPALELRSVCAVVSFGSHACL